MKLDDRKTRRMMDRMGINMKEIADVEEVVIKTSWKEIHIHDAQVSEVIAQGNRIFQVMGDVEEIEKERNKFSDEDILLVQQQANVSKEKAVVALEESDGEVAKAILRLTT
jgi:nascent polypeptide-associated complex subunit alpha